MLAGVSGHHIGDRSVHFTWDNTISPVLTVAPDEAVSLDLLDASGGQLSPASKDGDVARLDILRVNPVTGPIRVDGAEPGDALVVRVREIHVGGWGWSALIPGFGLLADDFPHPLIVHHRTADGAVHLPFGPVLSAAPMIGTLGVALPEPGAHPLLPPSRFGGNMDVRQLTADSTVVLPVGVEGALLSAGDTHATMGDGEVCGTGVETAGQVLLEVDVRKGAAPPAPILETSADVHRSGRLLVATGVAPDLMVAARDAARSLVDQIAARTGLAPEHAYVLCSLSADLVISEIVDAPNWVVSLQIPLDVLG